MTHFTGCLQPISNAIIHLINKDMNTRWFSDVDSITHIQ